MRGWKSVLNVGLLSLSASAFTACNAPNAATANNFSAERIGADVPAGGASFAASAPGGPRLVRVYFNPYVDSIKTVLNYYVNVEGQYSDGSYLPLDTADIILRCNHGVLAGNEWIIPKRIDFEKVTFIAEARRNPQLRDTVTLWIQKWKDPRDAPDYRESDEERGRRR